MPYSMVHLIIANNILGSGIDVLEPSAFILGSIAPDAVHFRRDYQSDMKKASHLCIGDEKWGHITNHEEWLLNATQFMMNHMDSQYRDFILGCYVHILTDYANSIKIWTPYRHKYRQEFESALKQYYSDLVRINCKLYREHADSPGILKLLEDSECITLDDIIYCDELRAWKSLLLNQYEDECAGDVSQNKYVTYDRTLEFIDEATESIKERLKPLVFKEVECMKKILETDRIYLRQMTRDDYGDLCEIMQDVEAMYAYEHAFSDDEVRKWLDKQLSNYEKYGFGLWAIIDKATGSFVGQAGLTMQNVESVEELEIGYLVKRKYWNRGYASESAKACRDYAFHELNKNRVVSIIRDSNIASQRVAEHMGMIIEKEFIKHYYNMDMPHYLYSIEKAGE